jgi:calcium/calmodulin-dependent protein kinase I
MAPSHAAADLVYDAELSTGAFGDVYSAMCIRTNTKVIAKHLLLLSPTAMPKYSHQLGDHNIELRALRSLQKSQHIVELLRADIALPARIVLVLAYCSGGDLQHYIVRHAPNGLSEDVAMQYMHYILLAIAHCHAHGVVHRDIKLENFVFAKADCKPEQLRLIDFGLAHIDAPHCGCGCYGCAGTATALTSAEPTARMWHKCGSLHYAAPELVAMSEEVYTCRVDCWAAGVCLFALLAGYLPFDNGDQSTPNDSIQKRIQNGKYNEWALHWQGVSRHTLALLRTLLCVDPTRRSPANEAATAVLPRDMQYNNNTSSRPARLSTSGGSSSLSFDIFNWVKTFLKRIFLPRMEEEGLSSVETNIV